MYFLAILIIATPIKDNITITTITTINPIIGLLIKEKTAFTTTTNITIIAMSTKMNAIYFKIPFITIYLLLFIFMLIP